MTRCRFAMPLSRRGARGKGCNPRRRTVRKAGTDARQGAMMRRHWFGYSVKVSACGFEALRVIAAAQRIDAHLAAA